MSIPGDRHDDLRRAHHAHLHLPAQGRLGVPVGPRVAARPGRATRARRGGPREGGGGGPAVSAPILEVRGVTKRFAGIVANEDVSFSVAEGEIVSIIGPNGAGKSTLFGCVTGFHRVTAGQVLYR